MPNIVACAQGENHILVLTDTNELYASGKNEMGQLGNGTIKSHSKPLKIEGIPDKVTAIAACNNYSLVLTNKREVYGWGDNSTNQLGGNNYPLTFLAPTKITDLPEDIVSISAEFLKSLFLTSKGEIFCLGNRGLSSALINISKKPFSRKFLIFNKNIVSLCSSLSHSLAIDKKGNMFAWGWNSNNQLGNADIKYLVKPKRVGGIPDKVVDIAANIQSSLALTSKSEIYQWGKVSLKNPDRKYLSYNSIIPQKVTGIEGIGVKIAAGRTFSLVLTNNGKVFGWGYINSKLDKNSYGFEYIPTLIEGLHPSLISSIFSSNGTIPKLSDLDNFQRYVLCQDIAL